MFASNPQHVFRPLSSSNNENIVAPAKSTMNGAMNKTPAASNKSRRALGDISNRKQGRITSGAQSTKKPQGVRLQLQRNPLTTKTPAPNKKKEVSFLPRPTQAKQVPSVKILSDLGSSKSTTSHTSAQVSLLKNKSKVTISDPIEDIERPAGRLWIDEPDDYSIGSVSLPEINWKASRQQLNELAIKQREEEDAREDAAYNEYIEQTLKNDGKY